MAVRRVCAAAVLVTGALLAGCADGSQCEVGAHVVREVGPSLVLDSATGPDGEPVPVVELSRIRFDGSPVDRRLLVSSHRSSGLSLDGGRLVCDLPCGLTGTAGRWELRVTGPDASTTRVEVRGEPRLDPGGCSPAVGQAPEIALRLEPADAP
jgi:hypothetical protein